MSRFYETPSMRPLDRDVVLMTLEEWVNGLSVHAFGRDDGVGYWATKKQQSRLNVFITSKPEWATHVAWYGK